MLENIYNVLWDNVFEYAGQVPENWLELCCTLCATVLSIFMIAIPFIVVWRVVTMIVKGW